MFDYAQKYEKGSFFLFFLIFLPKIAQNGPFFSFLVVNFFSHTPLLSVIYFLLQFLTVSSGLKFSIMLKNMKKARFSYFSWFICQKGPFLHFQWSVFFLTNPHYLWSTFFAVFDCFIRLKLFDYAQKYKKKANCSYFTWFFAKNCQKLSFFSF